MNKYNINMTEIRLIKMEKYSIMILDEKMKKGGRRRNV